jgi:hypothetical protein
VPQPRLEAQLANPSACEVVRPPVFLALAARMGKGIIEPRWGALAIAIWPVEKISAAAFPGSLRYKLVWRPLAGCCWFEDVLGRVRGVSLGD